MTTDTSVAPETTFQIEELLPDGVRYTLPQRHLGNLRWIGHFLALFGLAFVGGSLFAMVHNLSAMFGGQGGIDWFEAFETLFCLPFLVAGGFVFGIGQLIVRGHNVIELRGGVLKTTERAGLFHRSWKRNVDEITSLAAYRAPVKLNDQPVKSGPLAEAGFIKVESGDRRRFLLAVVYPYTLCTKLAEDLGRRLHAKVELPEKPWDIELEGAPPSGAPATAERPKASNVKLERFDDGLTLKVPPAGLKGSKGLFGFSLFWCGLMAVFTSIVALAGIDTGDSSIWILVGFLALFWLIGAGLMAGALNMAKRQAVLAVVDDSLMVLQTGLFGSKRKEWTRDQLESVCCGPSGMTVNNVPVMELQIHPREGKKFGLLASRSNAELRWMAGVLARALRLEA